MLTITATDFKATCLDILDRISSGELAELAITKRGRVVALLRTPEVTPADAESLFGCMRGSLGLSEDVDLTQPIFEGTINAELGLLHE